VILDSRGRRQAEIPNTVKGALVTNVDPESNAAEAGLKAGDVILEINRQPVRSSDESGFLSEKVAQRPHSAARLEPGGRRTGRHALFSSG